VYLLLVTSRDIISRLKADGWELVNVRGSHHQYKHPLREGRVTVPHPKKDFPKGTLRSIFKQAGWKWPPTKP
jgi:predicted RNA binding protein YcfA (HicA-like mRNA interferase family)